MSVGVAMATYTAQNFGAGKYDRILEGVKSSLKMSISMSFVLGAIEVIFGRI